MNVLKYNNGSSLPKRNRKYAFLLHLLRLWVTPGLHICRAVNLLDVTSCGHPLVKHCSSFLPVIVSVWVLIRDGALQKELWYSALLQYSQNSFTTYSGFTESIRFSTWWMNLKNLPVNLIWKKVLLISSLGSGLEESGLNRKHANKKAQVQEARGAWVQTQCYAPLTGRPLAGHLTCLCSNKPNCKFVHKLKTPHCAWEELTQAKILNSHVQVWCVLLWAVLIWPSGFFFLLLLFWLFWKEKMVHWTTILT